MQGSHKEDQLKLTFETVKPFLKASKSEHVDNGPYRIRRGDPEATWFEITDKDGRIVGQITDPQIEDAPRHSGGCSNQNVLDPVGAYRGAQECGCQDG